MGIGKGPFGYTVSMAWRSGSSVPDRSEWPERHYSWNLIVTKLALADVIV
jgi:hypothetical protein